MSKGIDNVIKFAKSFVKKGFKLVYAPENQSKLVQVYMINSREVMVTGPPRWVNEIHEAIEGN